jgi:hypothetical protein
MGVSGLLSVNQREAFAEAIATTAKANAITLLFFH